jgi:hypothetical protein
MQLEREAMQLNRQNSNFELAACQHNASLNQRAMEVRSMEQATRHEAIQKILYVEAEAYSYILHCEQDLQRQQSLAQAQECMMATVKSEFLQHVLAYHKCEHDLAEQRHRNIEFEETTQRFVEHQQAEIVQLAQVTLSQQKENDAAQKSLQEARHREQELTAYHDASSQQQLGSKDALFNEAMAGNGRLESECHKFSTKLAFAEYYAKLSQRGALSNNSEFREQQRKNELLTCEYASMARQKSEQDTRLAERSNELDSCRSEEAAYQKASRKSEEDLESEKALAELWK